MSVSIEQRDSIFKQYLPLADKIYIRRAKSLPKSIPLDDLQSAAYEGLLDAATKYDPEKKAQFAAYAKIRIYGSINDYLRRCIFGKRVSPIRSVPLDVPIYGARPQMSHPLRECLASINNLSREETEDFFMMLTKELPQRGRNLLRYYFIHNFTMREIGIMEGVTESLIFQLLSYYKEILQKKWANKEQYLWELIRKPSSSNPIVKYNKIENGRLLN